MKFLRYLLIQIAAYGLDIFIFIVSITYLDIEPLFGNVFGKILSAVFAYYAHSYFTFGLAKSLIHTRMILRYSLSLLVNLFLTTMMLWLIMLFLPSPVLAKFVADVICFSVTYLIVKKYVFIHDQDSAVI